ncbi:hypothetical protein E4K67_18295 [Desulfosporosinus fructosivorans]|uniref:Uncharacterized protein n=1 Tax=Desulfosporosinus fructosivorans TaxID=2018669 RepID=A0A4Z0R2V4_9FIRM|nr:hypothetical protein E4K67_18295 [Desulfosporosinus fructosivorans]
MILDISSTFEHFRDRWTPSVSDWVSYTDWQNSGSKDILIRANKKFKKILASSSETLIDKELENSLKLYMHKTFTV